MRRTLRIKNSPVAMFYSRINAFIIVLRVNFSLSDNFLLLFSICLKLPFHPQYKYKYLLSLTFSFSLSSLSHVLLLYYKLLYRTRKITVK